MRVENLDCVNDPIKPFNAAAVHRFTQRLCKVLLVCVAVGMITRGTVLVGLSSVHKLLNEQYALLYSAKQTVSLREVLWHER